MVNKPKQIGTAAETAVLRVIKPFYADAKRVVLHGGHDQGDIHGGYDDRGRPLITFEVKGGKQAKGSNASAEPATGNVSGWLAETELERQNADALFGFLVCQRAGVGPANALRWWAWTTVGVLTQIATGDLGYDAQPVRLELGDLLSLLDSYGYTRRGSQE